MVSPLSTRPFPAPLPMINTIYTVSNYTENYSKMCACIVTRSVVILCRKKNKKCINALVLRLFMTVFFSLCLHQSLPGNGCCTNAPMHAVPYSPSTQCVDVSAKTYEGQLELGQAKGGE